MKSVWSAAVALCIAIAVVFGLRRFSAWKADALAFSRAQVRLLADLTIGGRPLRGVSVLIARPGGAIIAATKPNASGHIAVALPEPGDYLLAIADSKANNPAALLSTSRVISLVKGDNALETDFPPTSVTVRVSSATGRLPRIVQLALTGPSSPTEPMRVGFITEGSGWSAHYVGLGYGDYTLSAFSGANSLPPLVSQELHAFSLSKDNPEAQLNVPLEARPLTISIVDEHGQPVPSAAAVTLNRPLSMLADGRFDGSNVPVGESVIVTASGYLPTCVRALDANRQDIVLSEHGTRTVKLTLLDAPTRPVGYLAGMPRSECAVPVSALDMEWEHRAKADELQIDLRNLPQGRYIYWASEQAPKLAFDIPGPPQVYTVPSTCKVCGG